MNYQKYMSQGSGKSGGSQGGDFQKYMDYQKYMPQGSDKKGGSQGGGYSQYMDYQKYMPQGGNKTRGDQGGDYQQYMDYQKYMSQGGGKGGSQGGDYTQYYQKYMSQGGGNNMSDANINLVSSDSNRLPHDNSGGYAKFYKDYVPMVKNWSNREEVNAAFTKRYAGSYVPAPSPAKS